MKYSNYLLLLLLFVACAAGQPKLSDTPPPHELWDELVKTYVKADGNVDYKGFLQDREKLTQYLDLLGSHHPNPDTWTKEEQLAYWINAYNAFTVELILRNYPLESIKDIKRLFIPLVNTPWDIKFFTLGGEKYNLDQIEHDILRKQFEEPRIHFAINCASFSCPQLRAEAYTAEKLEQQLQEQTILFINNADKNIISKDEVQLSKIFSWFSGDFTKKGSLIEYLNQYAKTIISSDAEIDYLDYNWELNE